MEISTLDRIIQDLLESYIKHFGYHFFNPLVIQVIVQNFNSCGLNYKENLKVRMKQSFTKISPGEPYN